jgi:hypothetical protein
VKALVEQMRKQPERIWSSPEVAGVMDVVQAALTAHLDPAIRHQVIHRKLENGRCQYALKPFPVAEAPAPTPTAAPTWTAPLMVAPRDGSDQIHVNPPPPPKPAPPAEAPQPEEEVAASPFSFLIHDDGDVDMYGVIELEDGGVRMTPAMVAKLKRMITWMPAA